METKDLIGNAQQREFTAFDAATKEMLSQKVAEKLQEKGYFDRLDHAKGIEKVQESEKSDAYKKVYNAELAKFDGAKSPADLSDEDKKKFFDAVDAAYEADGEEPEPGDK